MKKKTVALLLALMLITGVAAGGTVAWLVDETDPIVNTFTDSDINITLTESKNLNLKMVPGGTITKDPIVTVKKGSEACWLFVKLEKSTNYATYLENYEMAVGTDGAVIWTQLKDAENNVIEGVYYTVVDALTADNAEDKTFKILKDNTLTVKTSVTKGEMDAIDGVVADGEEPTSETQNRPTLTVTAYAVQSANLDYVDNVDQALTAWNKISTTTNDSTN